MRLRKHLRRIEKNRIKVGKLSVTGEATLATATITTGTITTLAGTTAGIDIINASKNLNVSGILLVDSVLQVPVNATTPATGNEGSFYVSGDATYFFFYINGTYKSGALV